MSILKNKYLQHGLKLAIVLGLLYFLAQKGFLSLEETKNALLQWHFILPAYFMFMFATSLSIVRWHYLLKASDIHLPLGRTLSLGLVGLFFNIALPGAVSGDVVKAIYVGRESPGNRAWALSSILFDRVAGVAGLILLSAGACLISFQQPWSGPLLKTLGLFVIIGASVIVAFFSYIFLVREKHDPLLAIFRKLENWNEKFGSFTRIYEGLRVYHQKRGIALLSILISVTIHLLVTSGFVLISKAAGVFDIPTLAIFVIVPLGLLVTAVPIAPGGVGTGHAGFAFLFGLLATQRGGDIFSIFFLYNLLQGIAGGLTYLRFKSVDPSILVTEEQKA